MVHISKFLFLLIHIDQKTVLGWFGMKDPTNGEINQTIESGYDLNTVNFEPSTNVSLKTFNLLIQGLWEKIQDGLTLADIENFLFFILFIRFIILALRYNLKTSFYITCIGLFAGYLWYRHLIDLVSMYRSVLLKLPFLHKLGMDAVQLRSLRRQIVLTDLKLGENAHWYNPGQVLYYAFTKGITHIDPETGFKYYMDPISMIVSNLPESSKLNILPLYYKIYNNLVPKIFDIFSKFWNQLSGVAAYVLITRIGKRYCPYLIRWHWTFLLIIGMVEQIFVYFIHRVYYFQTFVLLPQTKSSINLVNVDVILQIKFLNVVIACVVLAHIGFVVFGLLHAIWGQYFYVPFFVENTELHIGPRPVTSIYSGGQTAWQDPTEKEKTLKRFFPKLWYGWFGRGTKNKWNIGYSLKVIFKKAIKVIKKII
jgi:hypothetical protein